MTQTAAKPMPQVAAPELSERVTEPLMHVAGRASTLHFLKALLQFAVFAGVGLLAVVMLLGLVERVATPVSIAVSLVLFAALGVALVVMIKRGARSTDVFTAARLVDEAVPETHERISSALSIADEPDARFKGSPELVAQLFRQAEGDAAKIDASRVVSAKRTGFWAAMVLPLGLAWVVAVLLFGPYVQTGLRRTLTPWREHAPPTVPTLQIRPGNVEVAQGDRVVIEVDITPPVGNPGSTVDRAEIESRFLTGGESQAVAAPLERTGERSFRAVFDNVQQSFNYRVTAGTATTEAYRVTVHSRPTVQAIDLTYTYPKYTKLGPKQASSRDGAIDALVGTRVGFVLTTEQAVTSAQLIIGEREKTRIVALTPTGERTYAAELDVLESTVYRIALRDERQLENREPGTRTITARPDLPPTVAITTPASPVMRVRPDDTVTLAVTASDDFGVSAVELLLQVDEHAVETRPLPFDARAALPLKLTHAIALTDVLKKYEGLDARRLNYQVRVTDNREPERQATLSQRQTLELDRKAAPLAQREDAAAVKELAESIKQSRERMRELESRLEALQKSAEKSPLTEAQKREAAEIRKALSEEAARLEKAAERHRGTAFGNIAEAAGKVANEPMKQAAEQAGKAALAEDRANAQRELGDAKKATQESREKLDALAKSLEKQADDRRTEQALHDLAERQQALAEAMAKGSRDPEKVAAEQRELQKELEKLMQENKELGKAGDEKARGQMAELDRKIEELRKAQQQQEEKARSAAEAAKAGERAKNLAKSQEQLNREVQEFNRRQQEALRNAGARAPEQDDLEPIVKDLQNKDFSKAAGQQEKQSEALNQAGKKMQEQAARNAPDAKAAERASQNAKDAAQLDQQATALKEQIDEAKKQLAPPTRPSDPANQKASELAEQVKQESKELSQQSPAQKNAAENASRAAEEAKRLAQQGKADEAQKKLAEATGQLKKAADEAQAATKKGQNAQEAAAEEAKSLAQRQQQLAEQTRKAAQSTTDAQTTKDQAQQIQQQQKELAQRMSQAAQQARQTAKENAGTSPEAAKGAEQAAQALERAAREQSQAASATGQHDQQQTAQRQSQSGQALSQASEAVREATPSSGNADSAAQAAQNAHEAQSKSAKGDAQAARQAAEQLQQASRAIAQRGTAAGSGSQQPTARGGSEPAGAALGPAQGGAEASMPSSVKDLGIAPSDWARLPPRVQSELENAAKQSGPPAYREQIKNYYTRISRLKPDEGQ